MQQFCKNTCQPLAYWSHKLTPSQQKYSTFGRELLAAYLAIRHFRPFVKGREFRLVTDHRPLTLAVQSSTAVHTPREQRHLDYIIQFTTDVIHISGVENVVSDALSRIYSTFEGINLQQIAELQQQDQEISELMASNSSNLKLGKKPVQTHPDCFIICDTSTENDRPLVPKSCRRTVFETLHNMSHPGRKASIKIISDRFVWPNMRKEIAQWTKPCQHCQKNKVHRHNRSSPAVFSLPTERFQNVHIDIIGPLPSCRNHQYILTMIDRFTRWPEACPIVDISASTIARAFIATWVSRYGVPKTIVSDRGSQFCSQLWTSLNTMLGCETLHTTAYNPAANGTVERFHRQLKSALRECSLWLDRLPIVLLGLRASIKSDLQCSSAELVFGSPLRLPGEMITRATSIPPAQLAEQLSSHFASVRPVPSRTTSCRPFSLPELSTSQHVFVRHDGHRWPLQSVYHGPYRVVSRTPKTISIEKGNSQERIGIDRVKPAFIENDHITPVPDTPDQNLLLQPDHHSSIISHQHPDSANIYRTRSGRAVRPPVRFTP